MAIIRMMAQIFVYKCTCGYIEQYTKPQAGVLKCPKCGKMMLPKQ
jgi:Zn finger protein HypA/HybF involved in hydrogenase expression